jgi:FtsP/CotA-like multicopper oxidase with cupredoxin domain
LPIGQLRPAAENSKPQIIILRPERGDKKKDYEITSLGIEPKKPNMLFVTSNQHGVMALYAGPAGCGGIASGRAMRPGLLLRHIRNAMMNAGQTEFSSQAALGEVVRLYLVNTANTRIFNFAVRGARMKLVGGDSGRYERETFVDEVLLSPSERAVVDVLFDSPGDVRLEHRTPNHVYNLGAFSVTATAVSDASRSFESLRVDPELTAERQLIEHDLERSPDKVLAFVAEMHLHGDDDMEVTSYVCPMHPDVTATEPGTCPKCGMKLLPSAAPPVPTPEPHEGAGHSAHKQGDGIEWEDLMPGINRASDPSNVRWKLIDRQSGAENGAISWAFRVGERVKIRLVNEMKSDHPMHHPLHIHGAGRFLILSRDGMPEPNLGWKDTVLVRMGETVDILLEVTNPGLWMVHCHIAEHSESGMMFSFQVSEKEQPSSPGTAHNGVHHGHHRG